MRWILRLSISVLLIVLFSINVVAGNTNGVTIFGVPFFSTGVDDFKIEYVSDNRLDLSWTYDPTKVKNVMIRSKYGSYPADITDPNVTPSDGNLVYYDNGTSFSDTSMDFNENTATIFYKAWGQKLDGTWYITTSTGSKESRELILIFFGLVFLGCLVTGFVFKRWLLFGAIIFICPIAILLNQSNPINNLQAWTWFLLIPIVAIPTLFFIMSSLLPKKQALADGLDEDNWREEEDDSYDREYQSYRKTSNMYRTKSNKRGKTYARKN